MSEKLAEKDLMDIELIYKTQIENGNKTIQLNVSSFNRLLWAAKEYLKSE